MTSLKKKQKYMFSTVIYLQVINLVCFVIEKGFLFCEVGTDI